MSKFTPLRYHCCSLCCSSAYIRPELHIDPYNQWYERAKFDTKQELADHQQTEEHKQNKKRLTCEICKYPALSEEGLERHRKEVHKQKPTCQTCGKVFPFLSRLQRHQHTHEPKEPKQTYQCCGKTFNFKSEYDRHLQTKSHNKSQQVISCCGYTFKYQSQYNRHLLSKKHSQQESNKSLEHRSN